MHDYAPLPKHVAKLPFLEGVRRAANDWYSGNQNWTKLQAPGSLIAFENTA